MKRRGNMTWEEFRKLRPAQAAQIEAEDAARKAGKPLPAQQLPAQGGWRPATPTHVMWIDGKVVKLPSKTEARVAERLIAEVQAMRAADAAKKRPLTRLYRQCHVALMTIDPRPGGCPTYLTVDFCIVHTDGRKQYIDAKPKKWKSPEWFRGKLAAQAELGIKIEETDR